MQVGTNYLGPLLDTEAKPVSRTDLLLAEIIRYAKSDNVATHFANFIFQNDDGTPVAFSKSGEYGRFEIRTAASPLFKFRTMEPSEEETRERVDTTGENRADSLEHTIGPAASVVHVGRGHQLGVLCAGVWVTVRGAEGATMTTAAVAGKVALLETSLRCER